MRFAMLLSAVALPALMAGNAAAGLAGPSDLPISANKLQLKSKNGKEKLLFLSKDPAIITPSTGSGDPTVYGATVELCSGADGYALFELPASGWKNGKVLKYVQKGGPPSGVKNMLVKSGRTMKIVGKDAGLDLGAPQGQVAVRVTMGATRMCALFAGPSVKTDAVGVFDGRNATAGAVSDCEDATLGCAPSSPVGAFVQ